MTIEMEREEECTLEKKKTVHIEKLLYICLKIAAPKREWVKEMDEMGTTLSIDLR